MTRPCAESLAELYLDAKGTLLTLGHSQELDWQADVRLERLTESAFLREAAWVILGCGFREARVREAFSGVSQAFLDWCSARQITVEREACISIALRIFHNPAKLKAIADVAERVDDIGFSRFRQFVEREGAAFLECLPYIGPVTSLHLAKNIGLSVVKPDRHLVRISKLAGFESPNALCETIAQQVGDSVALIDLVIWRIEVESPTYWQQRLSDLNRLRGQGPVGFTRVRGRQRMRI